MFQLSSYKLLMICNFRVDGIVQYFIIIYITLTPLHSSLGMTKYSEPLPMIILKGNHIT